MSNAQIKMDILRLSQEAIKIAQEISALWDEAVSEHVEDKLKEAA
ncbi:hypothetical protein ACFGWY_04610 [Pasteurella multocida]